MGLPHALGTELRPRALGKGQGHTRGETRPFQLLYQQVFGAYFSLLDGRAGPDHLQMSLAT